MKKKRLYRMLQSAYLMGVGDGKVKVDTLKKLKVWAKNKEEYSNYLTDLERKYEPWLEKIDIRNNLKSKLDKVDEAWRKLNEI